VALRRRERSFFVSDYLFINGAVYTEKHQLTYCCSVYFALIGTFPWRQSCTTEGA